MFPKVIVEARLLLVIMVAPEIAHDSRLIPGPYSVTSARGFIDAMYEAASVNRPAVPQAGSRMVAQVCRRRQDVRVGGDEEAGD
ncbi:hypothetical protein SALBM135S_03468 [Streptomyces alboniger]